VILFFCFLWVLFCMRILFEYEWGKDLAGRIFKEGLV